MVKFSFGDKKGGRADSGKSSSIGGKIFAALFFFVFFAMGTAFEIFIIHEFAKSVAQRFWKQTPCKILASNIEEDHKEDDPFTFEVRYEYEYNARKYTSAIYKRGYKSHDEYHKADKMLRRYPAGRDALCYVNPRNPSEAVLRRGSLLFGFVILFPLIFVLIGGGGIYVTLFGREKIKGKTKPIAPKRRRKKSEYVGIGVFAIFALVGAGMLYPLTIRPVAKTVSARKWVETPCKILYARVKSHEGDDSTTYSVDIFYEYNFEGQIYKSSRYGFIGGSSSGYSGKAKVVDSYRKAKDPVCYVNPKDPSEAVLKRSLGLGVLICLIPLPFFAVGIGGIVHSVRKKRKLALQPTARADYSAA